MFFSCNALKRARIHLEEYIHLAKQDGQWLIVNIIWADRRAGV